MDRRLLVYVACVVSLLPLLVIASCPSGERYCPDRGGCISTSQDCSDGDIVTCINMTAPCYNNGTLHCLDAGNYTCGNITCGNDTQYCPTKNDCIDMDDHCCTEKEESCMGVVKYKYFFSRSETVDSICHLLASDDGNFAANYTELKYNNPLEEDEMCHNGTYFCPLVLHCIPVNHSCDPDRVFGMSPDDVFEQECGVNETFCSLYMHCIPSTENCSYRALFDWHDAGDKSVDLFSQPCPQNQTFCPLTFSCGDSCEPLDIIGNRSCNGTKGDMCRKAMECGVNGTECKGKLSAANFTNVTDATGSGWLETCKYRKLISSVLWEKASECKLHAEKCKKEEKECDFEICEKLHYMNKTEWIWGQIELEGNASLWIGSCNFTVDAYMMQDCNLTMEPKNMSCDPERLCDILEEKMEYRNMPMNGSMWIEECNVTINASVKMHECNLTMEHKNMSCDPERVCDILEEEMEYGNTSMSGDMWIEECNITINASTKMHECNFTKHHNNMSCDPKRLCDILEEKKEYGNMSMSGNMWIEDCNITINASTKMHECNLTKDHKSCNIHELCDDLEDEIEEYENGNMINETVTVEDCNITLNEQFYQICKKNRSCEIHTLCKPLIENNYNQSKINTTIRVEGCNVVFNQTVIDTCQISFHSCKIEELCPKYRELAVNRTKKSFPKMVQGCEVDWDEMEQCNITFKNDSCEVHKLCHLLRDALRKYKNGSAMNESVTVDDCSINVDRKVYDICGNHSCELSELCKPLRKKLDKERDWVWSMMNSTIEVKMCNLTLNHTVLEECNITMEKNDSKNCKINKLCKPIRKNNYNSSMLNMTIHIEDCEIMFDKEVLHACNITFEPSCKVEDLCSRYRALGLMHTRYSFPKYVGECKVNMDDFEQCNVTLQQLTEYYYNIFYNGFKISDSVKKNVSHIAIRDVGMGMVYGHWEYENSGTWTPLGPVSSDRAIVLASTIRLRFMANDSSWHGLTTLMYTPVKSRPTGSHVDVSDTLHDPRNTLALLQYPSRPVANVWSIVDTYTVGEDEEGPGFMITNKMKMSLNHTAMDDPMDGNMSEYFEHLDSKMVQDYNETVKCFKEFEPAIAIIDVGKSSQGTWEVNERGVSSASKAKPKVVAPRDLLRFVSAEHVHGNWSMKFVAVAYSNCSGSVKAEYGAPVPFAHALRGVMMMQKTSKQVKRLLELALKIMASTDTYSLANFNGAVDSLSGSTQDKNKVKDIASEAFDAVTLPQEKPRSGLPRSLNVKGSLVFLNNPNVYTFKVHVTPTNDQPEVESPRIFLPAIAYNVTTSANSGKLVKDLLIEARASDVDEDKLGIAIVQALNTSLGSWYYKSPSGVWTQVIVDNAEYSDGLRGSVSAMILNSGYLLKFQMHDDDILWNNLEASQKAKIVFLPWDGSDSAKFGWRNVSRPSEDTSAYGKKSVTAIVRRFGCDGREGSKGKNDRCGVCGGDGESCLGCDDILNSGAVRDDCGNCTGGTTNVSFNAMKDCANECGFSFLDNCRTCQRKDRFVNFTDCTGTCYGQAKINKCSFCAGGTSGKAVTHGEDACGVCSGDNSTCLDCARVPNGGKVRDYCTKCLLPSDSRFNSECVKLKRIVPNSGPSDGGMKVIVRGAGLKTYSRVSCHVVNNATNARSEIPSSSFAENGGRVIQFTTPALAPGYYTILCLFDSEDVSHPVEETFLVYNKSAITYTSISPDSTDINMAETAVIMGSGFVNTLDIACVSRDGRVFEAEFESSTRVSCSIPATKNSVRLSLGVSFSRGDRRLGENNVNFTIYANASNPTSARFLNSLRGVVVHFDVPTKPKMRSDACSTFFPSGNVSLFGFKSKCVFLTSVKMMIRLRGRPTIVPNDAVKFRLHSITQRHQKVTKEPAEMYKDLVIAPPTIPVIPTAKLTGTSFLGICAKLRLNGGQSYGAGGRRLTFIWNVTWDDPSDLSITANATDDLQEIREYLNLLPAFQSKVKAKHDMIVVGLRYKFTLKVRNFLGQESDEASLEVLREDKSLPGLRLGSKRKRIKTALGTTLQGQITLSSCLPAGYQPTVLFTWEIQAVGVNLGVVDKSRLTIASNLLVGGKTYTLTLTAAMASDISLDTTATIELEVESSPLRAIIKGGGSRVVGEDDNFVLDGSRSSDPDRTSDTAIYNWQCFDADDKPCFETDSDNPGRLKRMVIPSGVKASINVAQTLKTNSIYKFVLIFKKGTRKSEASVDVIVKSGAPPLVLMRPIAAAKVNPTDPLIIESLIVSKKTVNVTWSCVQSEEYGFVDLEAEGVARTSRIHTFVRKSGKDKVVASPSLVISKNKLQDGVTYKFKLTAEHSDSSSFADIEIATNAAPSQGTLEIEPASGFFGNTTFTFTAAEGWDDDADDLPMMYQFGYYIQDSGELREELLGTPSEANSLEVDLLPQGEAANNYSLKVFVKVSDIYGAVTTQEATVAVKSIPLDASAVKELAGAVDSDFESGDLAKGAAKANAIAAALSSSNTNDPNTTKAAKEFKNGVTDKVLSSVEGGGVQDKSGRDVVKGSLLQMTIGCKPNCNPGRVLRNLLAMFVARSFSKRRRRAVVVDYDSFDVKTAADVEGILKISQNVINPDDYTNSSLEAKASFLSTVQGQEPSLCKGLATGGPYELAKTNITVMKAVKDPFSSVDTEFMEVSTSTAPEYIEASVMYRLGQTLKTQYESWACTADDTCTGTCIATAQFKDDLLIQHDPAEKNMTRLSDVASIRLYNPQTLAEISVSGLANPVALRFPIDHGEMYENYTKECRIWHEGSQEWQMSGCTGSTSNNSTVECSCTQLGYIAVFLGEKKLPTTAPPTTQNPSNARTTVTPEEAQVVEFAFDANYSQVISGNTTKSVFISHLRPFFANLLNISQARITNIDIRSGSIIVTFTILPSNNTNEASVNSTVLHLEQLVKTNNVNLTLPGSNETLRVDPSSFKIVSPTTGAPTLKSDDDDDDDGLSTAEIVIIVVVCVVVVIALIAGLVYYFARVKPARAGKISPHSSHIQLNEQQNNNQVGKTGVDNNAVVTDEKAV